MKLKLPKLHNQIVIALVLGALFGALFNVNTKRLNINYEKNSITHTVSVEDWESFIFITSKDTITFGEKSQLEILQKFKRVKKENSKVKFIINNSLINDEQKEIFVIDNPVTISKESTIATSIKWLGDIFIRLLNMIAVPLVLASLTVGAASLGDIKKFARIGGKTIFYYLTTTAFAIAIGLTLANTIKPGTRMDPDTRERLLSVYSEDTSEKLQTELDVDIIDQIVNIVPKNPIGALADGEMIQIVFFSVLLGLVLSVIKKDYSQPVISFFEGLSEAMIKIVDFVMIIAPIGVFALIAAIVSEFGFDILQTLIWYSLVVLVGLALHIYVVYSLLLKLFTRVKASLFWKKMKQVQLIAFSTSSSAATLPVNMETAEEKLGVPKSITSFVLPLGATINMDGTALYQGVAAVFIAQVFGMDLTLGDQLTILFTATLASIGTAPVPGVGLIMLVIILRSVGIPQAGLALILGVDRILDMCRTITNVSGDATGNLIIAHSEKVLDYEIADKPLESLS